MEGNTEMTNLTAICKAAIEYYGEVPQKAKATEELAELITELARDINDDHASRENVIDEIADCNIMLRQLSIMYGEGNVLMRTYDKANRLADILKDDMKSELELYK